MVSKGIPAVRLVSKGYGFSKPIDTNDTRESAAIYVCRDLLRERARLMIYDPKVTEQQVQRELEQACRHPRTGDMSAADRAVLEQNVTIATSAEEAARDAHAVALLTEWDEFRHVDFAKIRRHMPSPAFVFDGRNLLAHPALKNLGFDVHAIGKSV